MKITLIFFNHYLIPSNRIFPTQKLYNDALKEFRGNRELTADQVARNHVFRIGQKIEMATANSQLISATVIQ